MAPDEIEDLANAFSGSYWNYRWLKFEVESPELDDNFEPTGKTEIENYYELHEVYYDKDEKPFMWTENPVDITCHDADGIIALIKASLNAAMEKVLFVKDDTITELDEYLDKYEILEQCRKE